MKSKTLKIYGNLADLKLASVLERIRNRTNVRKADIPIPVTRHRKAMEPCGSLCPELVQRLTKKRNEDPKKPLVSTNSTPP